MKQYTKFNLVSHIFLQCCLNNIQAWAFVLEDVRSQLFRVLNSEISFLRIWTSTLLLEYCLWLILLEIFCHNPNSTVQIFLQIMVDINTYRNRIGTFNRNSNDKVLKFNRFLYSEETASEKNGKAAKNGLQVFLKVLLIFSLIHPSLFPDSVLTALAHTTACWRLPAPASHSWTARFGYDISWSCMPNPQVLCIVKARRKKTIS